MLRGPRQQDRRLPNPTKAGYRQPLLLSAWSDASKIEQYLRRFIGIASAGYANEALQKVLVGHCLPPLVNGEEVSIPEII
jgi:hypothetical protein